MKAADRARVLLDAPDPLYAVAYELAEWEARMDVLAARLQAFEQRIIRIEADAK